MGALPLLLFICCAVLLHGGESFKTCVGKKYSPSARVLARGDKGYSDVISVGQFPEPHPEYVAQVKSKRQISAVVKCASEAGLGVCVWFGWDNAFGPSSCDGVALDLSFMQRHRYNNTRGNNLITVEAGMPAGNMFKAVVDESMEERFQPIGASSSVGVGAILAGGGLSPYSSSLDVTCRSVRGVKYVLSDGSFVEATPENNSELFWASCGSGGSLFGVLYEATLQTHSSSIPNFNEHVIFRYEWPRASAGKVMHSFLDFDAQKGMLWARIEVSRNTRTVAAVGVCFDTSTIQACEKRLKKVTFFNVPGRVAKILKKQKGVAAFQKFIGPAGDNGRVVPDISDARAFRETRSRDEKNLLSRKAFSSRFYRWAASKPDESVWQKIAENVLSADVRSLIFRLNPFSARNKSGWLNPFPTVQDMAFAQRSSDGMTELIAQERVDDIIKVVDASLRKWQSGIYPGHGESVDDKEYMYWGASLPRLVALREKIDPTGLFNNKLGLPGSVACPGTMEVSGDGSERVLSLKVKYRQGQMAGMRAKFTAKGQDCGRLLLTGGELIFDEKARVYIVIFDSAEPAKLSTGGARCQIATESINDIPC